MATLFQLHTLYSLELSANVIFTVNSCWLEGESCDLFQGIILTVAWKHQYKLISATWCVARFEFLGVRSTALNSVDRSNSWSRGPQLLPLCSDDFIIQCISLYLHTLDNRGLIPARVCDESVGHRVHTGYGAVATACPMGAGGFSFGGDWPGRDIDHSLPPNVSIKNVWSYTSFQPHDFMTWGFGKETGVTF